MSTPTVTEITRRPEPVAHDGFIDDLRAPRADPEPWLAVRGAVPGGSRLRVA